MNTGLSYTTVLNRTASAPAPAHIKPSLLLLLALLAFLVLPTTGWTQARSMEFAGMSWSIRQTAGPSAPGPTTFSNAPDQVWIDSQGRLHLSVALRDGVWTGSEIAARRDTGYGTYRFDMDASKLRSLDPNLVFGFFTWDVRALDAFNREIDIEISKWGNPSSPCGWFTVQPYDREGNQHSFYLPAGEILTFEMKWEPGSVTFVVFADGKEKTRWRHTDQVPDPGRARLRINFWTFQGKAPKGTGPYEVVLWNLSYVPLR